MPSFSYRKDYKLSAGLNAKDLDLSFLAAYKNPYVTAVDVVIVTGAVGTALVSASLVDPNKSYGVALINSEPLWIPNKGVAWDGKVPVDWASWLRVTVENATLNEVVRVVMVIEHA